MICLCLSNRFANLLTPRGRANQKSVTVAIKLLPISFSESSISVDLSEDLNPCNNMIDYVCTHTFISVWCLANVNKSDNRVERDS